MPAGGLYSLLPAIAATLRTLRIHLRAPALLSRDFVGLGRLAALTALHLDVAVRDCLSELTLLHFAFRNRLPGT